MARPEDHQTLEDYRWLISAEAGKWLSELAGSGEPLHVWARRLRRQLSQHRVHLLLEQVELRRKGREKFAHADRMFFTRIGLEQATDQWIAMHKAKRFERGQLAADLCCGIGGDLLGLAPRCTVTAVDRDRTVLLLATANLAATWGELPVEQTIFFASDASACAVEQWDAWHIDPDRRAGSGRTSQPQASSPSSDVVLGLLNRNPNAAIKLAPAANLSERWARESELEWIGRGGECKQLVVWQGQLAHEQGLRRATIVKRDDSQPEGYLVAGWISGVAELEMELASAPRRYLHEPEPAVRAARLQAALARRHRLQALTPGGVWLTGDAPLADGCLACFEVLDVLPLDYKRLNRYFSQRSIGRLEIKSRGVEVSPETLRKQLELKGEQSATLVVTGVSGVTRAIVARRLQSAA